MTITMTGASGFVGSRVLAELLNGGHQVRVLGRKRGAHLPASVSWYQWGGNDRPAPEALEGSEAMIHLAGEPVAQRWTSEAKAKIRNSRVEGTRFLVEALAHQRRPPAVLVSASAIGLYGSRGDEILTETSPPGQGFLSEVVSEWENAARAAELASIRVVRLRLGVVLGRGGALAKILPPFRLGFGGRIGSGRQWMSWIHIEDAVRLMLFALDNPALAGAVNATAPNPVTNSEFTSELAHVLHRPAVFPVPEFALELLFGEMAGVLISGQRVLPKVAPAAGFQFHYPELRPALTHILTSEKPAFEGE